MMTQQQTANEFSRMFSRAGLRDAEVVLDVTATPDECSAVADRLGLIAIRELKARLRIVPWRRNGFAVAGEFRALVVQNCVVSLEPFDATVELPLAVRYTDAEDPVLRHVETPEGEILVDPVGDDDPEILVGSGADLGEFVVECLATALDPHPRRPGSDFGEVMADLPASVEPLEEAADNPFSVLERLKRPEGNG
jgi:hypothetical protein